MMRMVLEVLEGVRDVVERGAALLVHGTGIDAL